MGRPQFAALVLALVGALTSFAEAAELCGDGLDNDSDSFADEGCFAGGGVTASPLSASLTGAVAPKSGAVTYTLPPDFAPHVAYGVPITFQRTFMSHYRPGVAAGYRNPFGNMWQHNWMSWLDKNTAPTPDTVIVHLPSGREVLFQYQSTAGGFDNYTPQAGAHFKYLRQSTSSPFNWELRSLTGETLVYNWSSPTGKLVEYRDSLATPNVTTVSYDASGRVEFVTDAQGTKRLKFTYNAANSKLTKVEYQTILSGTATTRSYADYAYNNNQIVNYQPGGPIAQTYNYASSNLTLIEDDAGNDLISYSWLAGTAPTSVARLKSSRGELGFEYNSARAACSGGTMVFFNRQGTTACDTDSDCGSGLLCGGQTNPATTNTGVCYRAARCLQFTSPNEDLVTTVAPVGPPSETCEGACTDVAEYAWNTSSVLDLKAVKDPAANWTSYTYNADGLPTKVVYGDNDNDATNAGGARVLYLFYGNATFPGRVTEKRRASDISASAGSCTASVTTGCKRTIYSYNADGLLSSRQEIGETFNSSGAATAYSYITGFTYDSKGRLTQIDGPLAGSNDVTDYTYWSAAADVFKDGQLKEIKAKKDPSTYLVTTLDDYDYWSNAKSVQRPDATFTCFTFHADRNYTTQTREAMNGQASCVSSHASDLVTSYARDRALRPTRVDHPAGGCTHHEYDSLGRLIRTKARDDCNTASAGSNREYTYDDDGLVIKTEAIDATGTVQSRQERTYYDSRRIATVTNPVDPTKSASIAYNSRGLVDSVEAESGLSKTSWTYDEDDRVETVARNRAVGDDDVWTLVHDWLADLVSITDEDAKEIEDIHDDLGRRVKLLPPDSGGIISVYNADHTLATTVELLPGVSPLTHTHTSDNLGRILTNDFDGTCAGASSPHAETILVYDSLPGAGAGACPAGMTCSRIAGRLAYVKTTLLCGASFGTDAALDQETWYAYDDAGRVIREYVSDDTGRAADHLYEWNKNGSLAKITTPSGAVIGWSFDSGGDNSDVSKISQVWRTSTSTLIAKNIAWRPFSTFSSYQHSNQVSGVDLRTVLVRNLADRISEARVETTAGTLVFKTAITEDAAGRVTARDFSSGIAGVKDSFFVYDKLDRILCESDTILASCPASPTTSTKNLHNASPPFTASNDWKQFERPIPGAALPANWTHTVNLVSGKDRISSVIQDSLGTTSYGYDGRGNRTSDDNTTSLTHDARSYTYDGRRNAITISGEFYAGTGGTVWHNYTVTNAFDAANRRVFKSFRDTTASKESQWFFYYDPLDRLTEIRATPDIASPSTYSVYQIFWLGNRPIHMWGTHYPATTTTRVYFHTDESNRPLETYDWPSSGNAMRTWAINPDAYGNDTCLTGCASLQPFVFDGQYRDVETTAWQNDGATVHRTALIHNRHRTYDAFVGAYIQVDPRASLSWDPYIYAANNPVGLNDPAGLAPNANCPKGVWACAEGVQPPDCYCSEPIPVSGTTPPEDWSLPWEDEDGFLGDPGEGPYDGDHLGGGGGGNDPPEPEPDPPTPKHVLGEDTTVVSTQAPTPNPCEQGCDLIPCMTDCLGAVSDTFEQCMAELIFLYGAWSPGGTRGGFLSLDEFPPEMDWIPTYLQMCGERVGGSNFECILACTENNNQRLIR